MQQAFSRRGFLGGAGALTAIGPKLARADVAEPITVFTARKIVTMQRDYPEARAVAVRGGRILAVGQSVDDLSPWTNGRTIRLERAFENDVLMPGLIDPHVHPMQGAALLPAEFIAPDDWRLPRGVSPGVRTPEGYRARLKEALGRTDPKVLFIAWGYHVFWHGEIGRRELDAMAPDRPVVIWQRSFHEIICNTAALNRLGLPLDQTALAAAIKPGMNIAHANVERGMFSETTLALGLEKLSPYLTDPKWLRSGFSDLRAMMLAGGVTTIADMATGIFTNFDMEADLIRREFEGVDAPQRVLLTPMAHQMMARFGSGQAARAGLDAFGAAHLAGTRVRLNNMVKLFADGAFFDLNMRMNLPGYIDGHQGKWLTDPPALRGLAREFWLNGFNIHTHVNGDEGLDVVLDILAALMDEHPRVDHRFTLEHLGYSTEEQSQRIARLGALVSAQPNYVYVLSEIYGRKGLGHDRADEISRLGDLERLGVPVALHSDFNMAPIRPLFLAWEAANRINIEGRTVAPNERLSVDAALRAVTSTAAYVIGMEREVGSIAAGKRADFAVLAEDPYALPALALKDIPIKGVVYEGRRFG